MSDIKRFSPEIEAWLATVLRTDEFTLFTRVNNLDNYPPGCRFSVSAPRRRKGQPSTGVGLWGSLAAFPEAMAAVLVRLGSARDPEGYEAACRAEEATGWGSETQEVPS